MILDKKEHNDRDGIEREWENKSHRILKGLLAKLVILIATNLSEKDYRK